MSTGQSHSASRSSSSPGRRARTLTVNLALAGLSTALTFGCLEVLARLATEAPGPPIARLYTEFDPLLGWRHRPGARADFPQGSYSINSRGLRDVERTYDAPPGTRRVLVLGDSFAEGYSVPFEDSVSRVLGRDLGGSGANVDVVNGGVVGYSTDQELLFYRSEASRYGARVVVLFFFYNDIRANILERIDRSPKPRLDCDDTRRIVNAPLPQPGTPAEARLHRPPPPPWHSAGVEWLRQRLAARPGAYDLLARLGFWPRFTPEAPPLDLDVFLKHPPSVDVQAWECTRHLLGALREEVASRGARFVVAYVPSKMEVSGRDWGLTRLRYGLHERDWDRGKVARDLAVAGADLGFPVLDLTPALRAADSALLGGPYHPHGGHWNALGHRVAAREVARFLGERGWLASE